MRAAPVPATRRALRSACGELRAGQHERPLRRHALRHRHALVRHDADGVVGPPRRGRDDGRHGVADFVPGPRHVAHVGEGQRRQPPVPGWLSTSVPRATAARLAWSKSAPLGWPVVPLVQTTATGSDEASCGQAVRPPLVHQVRASARVTTSAVPASGSGPPPRGRPPGGRARPGPGWRPPRRAPMRGLIPDVMAPRRSSAGVEHGVVDGRGQEQADDVALGHTEAGQVAGHAVGGAVPFGEGQAAPPAARRRARRTPRRRR